MIGMFDSMLGFAGLLAAAGAAPAEPDGFALPEGLLGAAAVVVGTVVATPGVGRGPAVVGVAFEAACVSVGQWFFLQGFLNKLHTLAAALIAAFISDMYSSSVSACGVVPEFLSSPPMLVPGFFDIPGIPATVSMSGSDEAGRA